MIENMNDNLHFYRHNCINLIKLLAALQVMFGHMIEHLDLSGNDPVLRTTYFFRGVPIFFVLSGFLIWFSIEHTKTFGQYLKKRFWRIYPELWVAVFVEIIIIIVLFHSWVPKQLFVFSVCQSTLFQFWTPESLRGYGVGTPNGTLWTIGVMVQFYIVVWPLHKLMKSRKFTTWIVGLIILFAISWAGGYSSHLFGYELITKLYDQTFIKYLWLFYIGMFVAKFSDILLPTLRKLWFLFVLFAFLFFWTGWDLFSGYYLGWSFFLTIGLIGFAYRFPQLSISPDISYGLFLYHMIVINVFVHFGWTGSWLYILPVSIIALLLAIASTFTVGFFSSTCKQKIN